MCDFLQDVITVWIALDDMTEELGAKKLPPFFAIQYLDKLNDRIAKTGSVQTRKENLRKSGITFVVPMTAPRAYLKIYPVVCPMI